MTTLHSAGSTLLSADLIDPDASGAYISFLQSSLAIVSSNQTTDKYCMVELENVLLGRANTLHCVTDNESDSSSHLLVKRKKPGKNAQLFVRKT